MNDINNIDRYRESIRSLERNANSGTCAHCGIPHPVRLHVGADLQVTPIYRASRPCDGYMRDMMSEIRALQRRAGLPENIC